MHFLSRNLYVKITIWMLLNLMLLAALGMGIGYSVLMGKNSDNALPASLFSTRADGTLRVISANLQYHSVLEWEELLRPYARTLPVQLHFYTLDTESIRDRSIPELMIEHAMRLPKAIYSFCPPPEVMFWDSMNTATTSETDSSNTEYGLPPVPPDPPEDQRGVLTPHSH